MTTLGQAYVQIMPSAKGISGSIQNAINPEATAAGKGAGSRIAEGISKSIGSVGSTLTKAITVPALGAATAVSGIVAALGWGRLTGLDSARAKLQGLGYEAEAVDRISGLVNQSIQGTVTTMAEGVSIAAGGLAAGVSEGAELERYIKLVGDAAVGANRPVNDMAQIFNRVQGSGKLMTQELNMIEDGMPGFAMAMADSLGVPQAEFRKMVTEGEVSSTQFLDVMDSFAGDMSDAYANSWAGMVANTKSNIGIIGESILGGVFAQSKESIADFLEYLRSDDVRAWAKQVGQSIGETFSRVVESVKNAIQWWTSLDGSTQRMIMTLTGIAIAIGPVLLIMSKLITAVMTVSKWFGLVKVAAGFVISAISAISAPVLIVTGVIAGLIALFVTLYQQNEAFRNLVQTVWATIQETMSIVIQAISDFVMEVWGGLTEWWNENLGLIQETMTTVWNAIQTVIMNALNFLEPFIAQVWETIKLKIAIVWEAIKTVIQVAITIIQGIIKTIMQLITGDWSGAWKTIKSTVTTIFNSVKRFISDTATMIWNNVKDRFQDVVDSVKEKMGNALETVTGIGNDILDFFGNLNLFDSGKALIQSAIDGILSVKDKIMGVVDDIVEGVRNYWPFSDAKVGPLSDISKMDFAGPITKSIENAENPIQSTMSGLADLTKYSMDEMLSMPVKATPYNGGLGSGENNVTALLNELINAVRENRDVFIDGERVTGRVNEVNAINAMIGGYMD